MTGAFALGLAAGSPKPSTSEAAGPCAQAATNSEWRFSVALEELDLSACACLGMVEAAASCSCPDVGGVGGSAHAAAGCVHAQHRDALAALVAGLRLLHVADSAWAEVPHGAGVLPPLPGHVRIVV